MTLDQAAIPDIDHPRSPVYPIDNSCLASVRDDLPWLEHGHQMLAARITSMTAEDGAAAGTLISAEMQLATRRSCTSAGVPVTRAIPLVTGKNRGNTPEGPAARAWLSTENRGVNVTFKGPDVMKAYQTQAGRVLVCRIASFGCDVAPGRTTIRNLRATLPEAMIFAPVITLRTRGISTFLPES
jgi:hypothetical protein